MAFDATVGGASANSFASVEAADLYLEDALSVPAAWSGDATKEKALVEATRDLALLAYDGQKATAAQALPFPRLYCKDPDSGADAESIYFSDSIIPARLVAATIELAVAYCADPTLRLTTQHSVEKVLVAQTLEGVMSKQWAVVGGEQQQPVIGLARFPRVAELVGPILAGGGVLRVRRM